MKSSSTIGLLLGFLLLFISSGASPWSPPLLASPPLGGPGLTGAAQAQALVVLSQGNDDLDLRRAPSLTPEMMDKILAHYGSPAQGSGRVFYDLGVQYGIDPAYALAFFVHESSAGTNPGWAGIKSDGSTTYNIGNIICTGTTRCYGRFRDYNSWGEGIEDWYRLIRDEYIHEGRTTVATIIPKYAPSFENDVDGYVTTVNSLVADWRKGIVR